MTDRRCQRAAAGRQVVFLGSSRARVAAALWQRQSATQAGEVAASVRACEVRMCAQCLVGVRRMPHPGGLFIVDVRGSGTPCSKVRAVQRECSRRPNKSWARMHANQAPGKCAHKRAAQRQDRESFCVFVLKLEDWQPRRHDKGTSALRKCEQQCHSCSQAGPPAPAR